jgi:hypothetical protein
MIGRGPSQHGLRRKEQAMQAYGRQAAVRLLTLVAVSACLAFVVAAPASAGPVALEGVQLPLATFGTQGCAPIDPVTNSTPLGENVMTGSLIGCWYTDTSNPHAAQPNGTPSGTVQATGAEDFVGCLDVGNDHDVSCDANDANGTLSTTYQVSAKFDPVTGLEVHGRCQHPIVPGSGTGVFTGATGVITFNDDLGIDAPPNSAQSGASTYRAQITLQS